MSQNILIFLQCLEHYYINIWGKLIHVGILQFQITTNNEINLVEI